MEYNAAYNRIVSSAHRLWLATALLALLPAALQSQDSWRVRVRGGLVQPGDVVRVEVAAPEGVTSVNGRWNDRAVPFERRSDGQWQALVGVDVAAAVGPAALMLTARRSAGNGAALTHTHALDIAPKKVRTRRITVSPKFVNPPKSALPRIERETKRLNQIFGASVGERLWAEGAVRPVEGVAVSGFGVRSVLNGQPRGPHNGLDLAADTGTPVYAPTPGLVVAAEEFYYSGNTVILDHGQGMFSTMAHLSAIDVKDGQRVEKGARLGKVGATGRVTGPHLHWAVRLNGARVDPLSLLDALTPAPSPTR
jgi:biotin carboxyl carrier protein